MQGNRPEVDHILAVKEQDLPDQQDLVNNKQEQEKERRMYRMCRLRR